MTAALDTRPASDHLLAAIHAAPADDAPRLIYADAIEEAEPERAEFIRVQVELAPMLADPKAAHVPGVSQMCGCRYCRLRNRERELLDNHRLSWAWPLPELLHKMEHHGETSELPWKFARGFVDSVTCTTAAFVEGVCEAVGRHHGDRCSDGRIQSPNAQFTQDCPACSGTGRRPGCAGPLFRAHPIERVTLVDREPYHSSENEWCWSRATRERGQDFREAAHWLPAELYGHLVLSRWLTTYYSTPDAAHAALSAAACLYGRAAATEGG